MTQSYTTQSIVLLRGTKKIIVNAYEHVVITEAELLDAIDVEITLGEYASVTYTLQNTTQSASLRTITFILYGAYSRVACTGVLHFKQEQSYNVCINQIHEGPYTSSCVDIKMVLEDASKASYKGMILIKKSGTKSSASQSHKSLVVSPLASVTSEPKLEVLTSDVICNHGSAISYVNGNHMFYLMSHGLSEELAKKIIIAGFLHS